MKLHQIKYNIKTAGNTSVKVTLCHLSPYVHGVLHDRHVRLALG